MGKMVERQTIVTWYKPEEKMPEPCHFVVTCISFRADQITYDHALVLANWADDDDDCQRERGQEGLFHRLKEL